MNLDLQNNRDRRRHGRIKCTRLVTSFGEVIDLSASGFKANCHGWRKPEIGTVMTFDIRHRHHRVTVTAIIVWLNRTGLRTYSAAFEFVGMDNKADQKKLMELARVSMQYASRDAC